MVLTCNSSAMPLQYFPRIQSVGVIHLTILRQIRVDKIHCNLLRCDRHAQVTRTRDHITIDVTVLRREIGVIGLVVARLGEFLINDPIQVLFDEDVVVSVKNGRDMIGN